MVIYLIYMIILNIKYLILEAMNKIDHEVRDLIEEIEVVENEQCDKSMTNNNIECSFFR